MAPAPVPKPTVSVGRRSAVSGLLAFGVLPALVIGVYALDWVKQPSDHDAREWSAGALQPEAGATQPVLSEESAADPPAASRTTPARRSGSTRPRRIQRTSVPAAPPREALPLGVAVALESIQGPKVIAATRTAGAIPPDAAAHRPGLVELAALTYEEGKAAFESGRYASARDGFRRVLGIIDRLSADEQRSLADLRLLASGFVELAEARVPPPAPIERVPSLPAPRAPYAAPVAVQEDLPPWMPPSGPAGRSEYVGVLRIRIGADGRVTGSEVLDASHPAYDAELLRAANSWLYRPATRDGRPVASVKDIQIRLVPR